MRTYSDQKKHEYWNYFIERAFVTGEKPSWVTGPRLCKIKPTVWKDTNFWWDILSCRATETHTPEQLRDEHFATYANCQQNFWGMMREIKEGVGK